ncbi:MAG: dephospho-CoA kinase [Desulfocapsa sp.]|uniref:Dephospho-CoA kinase n=1 Tax=Desulfotalea psychrophila TaxID=84980 RepID=A0ABS3AT98_9BACT|nr:dephospho-CoA kinase [Desulfocapsa sp.]MBN4067996.1 dephospho-CoA kinase [Desulfotalea psychrophila]
MNIAVTGGIGAGKSFVAESLAKMIGAKNISADLVCRDLLEIGEPGYKEIRKHFSADFFLVDGQLNRSLLRKAIFSNDSLRSQLDALLHPLVREELLFYCKEAKKKNRNLVVEVPLLLEKGWQGDFDAILVVYADEKTCLKRIMDRDMVSVDDARASIACQMPLPDKCEFGDWVIDNSGSYDHSLKQLEQLVEELGAER